VAARGAAPDGEGVAAMTDSPALPPPDIEGRSLLAQYLRPSIFPADVDLLVATAREEQAPPSAIALLEALPPATYQTTNEVWLALGGTAEGRPSPPDEAAGPEPEEDRPQQPEDDAPEWPDRVAEASGALVAGAVRLMLAVPAGFEMWVRGLVKRG